MTKAAAMQSFWSGFGLPAYEETTVPPDASFPRITYQLVTDSFGSPVFFSASLWYRGTSWKNINAKAEEISKGIGYNGRRVPYDNGFIWIQRGKPFGNNMGDPNDNTIRRKLLNITAEYISAD